MTQRGFNLIEMTLVMALIVGLGAFTYKLFKPSASMAAIRTEQSRSGQIVQSLTDLYVLQPSYAGLSTATLESTYNSKFIVRNGTLDTPSSVGASAIVQPGTAFGTNDSIDLIYQSVPSGSCVNLATALARSADFVRINSVEVQKPYSKLREDLLATQCATRNGNEVLFRYTNKSVSSQATDMLACECSPTIETQTLACPDNASGSITQRRNATCPATSCPSRQWTSWVTISNTCGANAAPVPMIDPHAPQAACVPNAEQRVSNCPSNQIGFVIEGRSRACPSEQWGAWAPVTRNCIDPGPPQTACEFDPATDKSTETTACPADQGGNIIRERYRNCKADGTKEWGEWQTMTNTCSASCTTTGTCCTPGRMQRATSVPCAIHTYGERNGVEQQYSRCANATTAPVWSGVWELKTSSVVGQCNACPADTSSTLSRTEPRSGSCPAGSYGNQTWEAVFNQSMTVAYACNSKSGQTSPGRSETYGAWVESGTRNHSSNCATCPSPYSETDEQWQRVDLGCPSGYAGQNSYEKQQHRQRTISFNCPNGQATAPSPSVGAWGGWYDTGAQRNHVNTCTISETFPTRLPVQTIRGAWARAGESGLGWAIACDNSTLTSLYGAHQYNAGQCIKNPNVSENFGYATWAPEYNGPFSFHRSGTITPAVSACLSSLTAQHYGMRISNIGATQINWPSQCSCEKLNRASVVAYEYTAVGWDSDGARLELYEYRCD
ncbi:type 4 pilus major pilin [Stenotrophomonas geniculata]|uniref:type 4 pilus major pilin n=1 Tax=Stenotrophomonas geniculata TaxID=86188 RepID=UPI003AAECCC2